MKEVWPVNTNVDIMVDYIKDKLASMDIAKFNDIKPLSPDYDLTRIHTYDTPYTKADIGEVKFDIIEENLQISFINHNPDVQAKDYLTVTVTPGEELTYDVTVNDAAEPHSPARFLANAQGLVNGYIKGLDVTTNLETSLDDLNGQISL